MSACASCHEADDHNDEDDSSSDDDEVAPSKFQNLRKAPSRILRRQRRASLRASSQAHSAILASLLEEEQQSPLELVRYLSQSSTPIEEVRRLSAQYSHLGPADVASRTRDELVEQLSAALFVVNTLWTVRRRVAFALPGDLEQRERDRLARRAVAKWRRFVERRKELRRREEIRAARAAGKRKWLPLNRAAYPARRPEPAPLAPAFAILVASDPSLTDSDPIGGGSFVITAASEQRAPTLAPPSAEQQSARLRSHSDPPSPLPARQRPSPAADAPPAPAADAEPEQTRSRSSSDGDSRAAVDTERLVRKKVLLLINELSTAINRLLKVSIPKLSGGHAAALLAPVDTLAAIHAKSQRIVLDLLRSCPAFQPPCPQLVAVADFFAAFLKLADAMKQLFSDRLQQAPHASSVPAGRSAAGLYTVLTAQRQLAKSVGDAFTVFESPASEKTTATADNTSLAPNLQRLTTLTELLAKTSMRWG